jgi:hypothetical protein
MVLMLSLWENNGNHYVSCDYQSPLGRVAFKVEELGVSSILDIPLARLVTQERLIVSRAPITCVQEEDQSFSYVRNLLIRYDKETVRIGAHLGWESREERPFYTMPTFANWLIETGKSEEESLSLEGLGLTTVPPFISLFQNLKELNLSRNHLRYLFFPRLADMPQLEVLDLSDNPLQEIPDVRHLLGLKKLIVKGCQLSVPEWIEQRPDLLIEGVEEPSLFDEEACQSDG